MIFVNISKRSIKSPLKVVLSHRFQSTAYGIWGWVIDISSQTSEPNIKALAQIVFAISCEQGVNIQISKGP